MCRIVSCSLRCSYQIKPNKMVMVMITYVALHHIVASSHSSKGCSRVYPQAIARVLIIIYLKDLIS